jgi:hypothetical protein
MEYFHLQIAQTSYPVTCPDHLPAGAVPDDPASILPPKLGISVETTVENQIHRKDGQHIGESSNMVFRRMAQDENVDAVDTLAQQVIHQRDCLTQSRLTRRRTTVHEDRPALRCANEGGVTLAQRQEVGSQRLT